MDKQPFQCPCGNDFFAIKTYVKITKQQYKRGQLFDATLLRKRLKCCECGTKYWDDQINNTQQELNKFWQQHRPPPK